jgi:NADPH:quinone reductase
MFAHAIMRRRMRAVVLSEFGPPAVLAPADVPDPIARDCQVLIDVAYANITFVETQFRATGFGPFKGELPVIPGNGVGGVVTAAGRGADPSWIGRRVVTSTGGTGGYAERVAVNADVLFPVPDGLPLDDAVALLADGRTAAMLIDSATIRAGERVLVEAAAGGVGTLLVQLARSAGAEVVAAAGGERKLALVRELGARVAVDYREPGWTERAGRVDVVFDGVGGATGRAAFGLLRRGGRMVSFGLASGERATIDDGDAAARGVTLVRPGATPEQMRGFTETVLARAAAGRLRPVIGQRFPLERAADAHAAIEARVTIGKTLLEVRPPGG